MFVAPSSSVCWSMSNIYFIDKDVTPSAESIQPEQSSSEQQLESIPKEKKQGETGKNITNGHEESKRAFTSNTTSLTNKRECLQNRTIPPRPEKYRIITDETIESKPKRINYPTVEHQQFNVATPKDGKNLGQPDTSNKDEQNGDRKITTTGNEPTSRNKSQPSVEKITRSSHHEVENESSKLLVPKKISDTQKDPNTNSTRLPTPSNGTKEDELFKMLTSENINDTPKDQDTNSKISTTLPLPSNGTQDVMKIDILATTISQHIQNVFMDLTRKSNCGVEEKTGTELAEPTEQKQAEATIINKQPLSNETTSKSKDKPIRPNNSQKAHTSYKKKSCRSTGQPFVRRTTRSSHHKVENELSNSLTSENINDMPKDPDTNSIITTNFPMPSNGTKEVVIETDNSALTSSEDPQILTDLTSEPNGDVKEETGAKLVMDQNLDISTEQKQEDATMVKENINDTNSKISTELPMPSNGTNDVIQTDILAMTSPENPDNKKQCLQNGTIPPRPEKCRIIGDEIIESKPKRINYSPVEHRQFNTAASKAEKSLGQPDRSDKNESKFLTSENINGKPKDPDTDSTSSTHLPMSSNGTKEDVTETDISAMPSLENSQSSLTDLTSKSNGTELAMDQKLSVSTEQKLEDAEILTEPSPDKTTSKGIKKRGRPFNGTKGDIKPRKSINKNNRGKRQYFVRRVTRSSHQIENELLKSILTENIDIETSSKSKIPSPMPLNGTQVEEAMETNFTKLPSSDNTQNSLTDITSRSNGNVEEQTTDMTALKGNRKRGRPKKNDSNTVHKKPRKSFVGQITSSSHVEETKSEDEQSKLSSSVNAQNSSNDSPSKSDAYVKWRTSTKIGEPSANTIMFEEKKKRGRPAKSNKSSCKELKKATTSSKKSFEKSKEEAMENNTLPSSEEVKTHVDPPTDQLFDELAMDFSKLSASEDEEEESGRSTIPLVTHKQAKHRPSKTIRLIAADDPIKRGAAKKAELKIKDSYVAKDVDDKTDDVNDEWNEKKDKVKKKKGRPLTEKLHTKFRETFLKFNLEFQQKNYATESLFPKLWPEKFDVLREEEAEEYLPLEKTSMKMCTEPMLGREKDEKWKIWSQFEGGIESGVPELFCGGPVWALAWAPIPTILHDKDVEQFLAVSTHLEMDLEIEQFKAYSGKNVIQIWNMGTLKSDGTTRKPELAYAVAHEGGTVWSMEWCPSGCYSTLHQSSLGRMGLLAAGCSDGCIRVYALPFPGDLPRDAQSQDKVYKIDPVRVLVFSQLEDCEDETSNDWQVQRLSWSREKDHAIIAAGFSNGYVALWDLTSSSPILLSGTTLNPFHKFYAHDHAVTVVGLMPYGDNRFLVTASLDRKVKMWNLEDTNCPISVNAGPMIVNGVWSSFYPSVVVTCDNAYNTGSSYLLRPRDPHYGHILLTPPESTTYAISANDAWNGVAEGTMTGRINLIFLPHSLTEKTVSKTVSSGSTVSVVDFKEKGEMTNDADVKTGTTQKMKVKDDGKTKAEDNFLPQPFEDSKHRYGLIFKDKLNSNVKRVDTSKKVDAIQHSFTSVNALSWNANLTSHSWLAAGYGNGLVRLLNFETLATSEQDSDFIRQFLSEV